MTTKTLEKAKLSVVLDFFKQFSKWCTPTAAAPTLTELEKYLSKDVQLFNNGKHVLKGAASYFERLQKFQKKYSKFQVSAPLEEPLISEGRIAIYYKLDLTTHAGQNKQIFILGLITIENDKISRWVEVTNEKDAGTWDA